MINILVAEGQRAFAKLISKKIEKEQGYKVKIACSMEEARSAISNGAGTYQLAILDVNLPGDESEEVIDLALSKKIPSIALVDPDEVEKNEKIREKGITDYVFKRTTEDIDYLVSQVKRVINNRRIKVLAVDDATTYRVAMKEMLRSQLFEVFVASDGVRALKVLKENPDIKIVLTDYNMPNMDGLELVANIRKIHKHDKLSVIVISGAAEKGIASKFLKLGANDFIQKPFSREEFNCRVNVNASHLELIENINNMANRDFLTGLYNRRYFFDAGEKSFREAVKNGGFLSVAMVDIDHFKKVNDTCGHDAGDLAIVFLAEVLEESIGPDDIVARFGGEEFCVLSKGADSDATRALIEKIRESVEQGTVKYKDEEIKMTISGGICVMGHGSKPFETLDEMINISDMALFEAKESGRNRICG